MGLKIEILCSSPDHPVNPWLMRWIDERTSQDTVKLVHDKSQLGSGDILFLIAVSEIIENQTLSRFEHSAVVHSSDLPEGRGWSPQVWAILNGAKEIVVSALVAAESVDSGPIWTKQTVAIPQHALHSEINAILFQTWSDVISRVCEMVTNGEKPTPQPKKPMTYWPRRTPADSRIDPNASIASQFDLLRVCDPERYPAYFELHGCTFEIRVQKKRTDD